MANDAVSRLYISCLGSSVVAFSAITVTRTGMEISNCMTSFTGDSVMSKYLGCGSGGWSTTALNVTGKAFCRISGVMAFN